MSVPEETDAYYWHKDMPGAPWEPVYYHSDPTGKITCGKGPYFRRIGSNLPHRFELYPNQVWGPKLEPPPEQGDRP